MKAIYTEDSYLRHFEARVERTESGQVMLNQTAFYPRSGGQPSDKGFISCRGGKYMVSGAELQEGEIWHTVDREGLQQGDQVCGRIDWERRYTFMRSHTACHILSAVIFQKTGAMITGNQIDLSKSRVDFSLENFDRDKMAEYVAAVNRIIQEDRKVITRTLPREEALAIPDLVRLAVGMPERVEVRIVEVEGIDIQACGGTHVRRTGEISGIRMIKAENKGKSNRRVYFQLAEGDEP